MIDNASNKLAEVMQLAELEAKGLEHKEITPLHILLGIIKQSNNSAALALEAIDIDLAKIKLELENQIESSGDSTSLKLPLFCLKFESNSRTSKRRK